MIIMERLVFRVRPGKWAEVEEYEKKFDAIEGPSGFPSKRRFRGSTGSRWNMDTHVIERQWDSLAAMEAVYEKIMTNAEWQTLNAEMESVVSEVHQELYFPLS